MSARAPSEVRRLRPQVALVPVPEGGWHLSVAGGGGGVCVCVCVGGVAWLRPAAAGWGLLAGGAWQAGSLARQCPADWGDQARVRAS